MTEGPDCDICPQVEPEVPEMERTVLCVCCPGQVGAEVVPSCGVWGVKVIGVEEEEAKAWRALMWGGKQSLSNLNVHTDD